MTFIDIQVIATLAYTTQFDYPLSAKEIFQRLLSEKALHDVFGKQSWFVDICTRADKGEASCFEQVRQSLEKLTRLRLLTKDSWRFCFFGKENDFSLRIERQAWAQSRLKKVEQAVNLLAHNPLVLGVALTGAEAMSNAVSEDDDFDFLIVTKEKTLWLARLLVLFTSWLKGKRQPFFFNQFGKTKGAWCFNLWLDERNLRLDVKRRNPYSAYELMQTRWFFNKNDVAKHFLDQNNWVEEFLPFFQKKIQPSSEKKSSALSRTILFLANWLLYWPQKLHLLNRVLIPATNISLGMGFFHQDNTRKMIYRRWQAIFKEQLQVFYQAENLDPRGMSAKRPQNQSKVNVRQVKARKVLVTGVFDVLHNEHVHFLQKAKELGNWLIVGIESDKRVRELKGKGRPINNQRKRLKQLYALSIADEIFILPEKFDSPKDHQKLIARIRPDFLAVSSHTPKIKEKQAILEKFSAKVVVVLDQNPHVSSTKLIEKMLDKRT